MKRYFKIIISLLIIEFGALFFNEIPDNFNRQKVLLANTDIDPPPPPPPPDPIENGPPQDSVIYLPNGEPIIIILE